MTTTSSKTAFATWTIDPVHTTVGFSVRHMMITTVRGEFQKVSGKVRYDAGHPEATEIEVAIPVDSVSTRDAQRDGHLRSGDFFDAAAHPTMTFRSTRARAAGADKLEVTGDLTIRGVTREVTLALSDIVEGRRDLQGKLRLGASAGATIRRSEFGMTFNKVMETGGIAVSDEVALTIDVSLVSDQEA
jgi:polyisoprenoid-binding protein YceI